MLNSTASSLRVRLIQELADDDSEYGLAPAMVDPQDKENRSAPESVSSRRGSVGPTLGDEICVTQEEIPAINEHEPDPNSPLVWKRLVNDHSLLKFLEERVQQEPEFKDQLLAYIEHSKKDKKWSIAAANAITILVRAGVQFSGTNLRGIRIPGADLSYGVFDSVDLQEANMRNVNLRGAWLRETDLRRTDMAGVQFGELPYLTGDSFVWSCAFSPDGTTLTVGFGGGDILVYSTSSWEVTRTLDDHNDAVRGLVYSPDGTVLVSGCWDKTVRLWNVESGVCQQILTDHTDGVNGVAFSPHGDQVASGSIDNTVRLWNPATGDCCQILSGHGDIVDCVAYSPMGDKVVSGSDDFTVRLWDVVTGECIFLFNSHSDEIWAVAFSPQGDQVASASKTGQFGYGMWNQEIASTP